MQMSTRRLAMSFSLFVVGLVVGALLPRPEPDFPAWDESEDGVLTPDPRLDDTYWTVGTMASHTH